MGPPMTPLAGIAVLLAELEADLPLARSRTDMGDGLRSPGLEPRVSGGGGGGSVQERAAQALDLDDVDERTGKVMPRRTPAAKLRRAEDDIAAARRALTNAYALAHRRAANKGETT